MRRIRTSELLALGAVEARRRLIEQQQRRLERQRARKADQLLHAERQRADQRVAMSGEAGEVEHLLDRLAMAQFLAPHAGKKEHLGQHVRRNAAMAAGQQIFQHRHLRKHFAVLEGAGDAEPRDLVRGRPLMSRRAGGSRPAPR